jgi:hypothetical protein
VLTNNVRAACAFAGHRFPPHPTSIPPLEAERRRSVPSAGRGGRATAPLHSHTAIFACSPAALRRTLAASSSTSTRRHATHRRCFLTAPHGGGAAARTSRRIFGFLRKKFWRQKTKKNTRCITRPPWVGSKPAGWWLGLHQPPWSFGFDSQTRGTREHRAPPCVKVPGSSRVPPIQGLASALR